MKSLPHAKSFRDLLAYQKARELQREVFRLTTTLPKRGSVCPDKSNTSLIAFDWRANRGGVGQAALHKSLCQ